MTVTFVTAFYNVGTYRKPIEYIQLFKLLPLHVMKNIILFTNKDSAKYLCTLTNQVRIEYIELDEMKVIPDNIKGIVHRYTVPYMKIIHNKVEFLKKAVETNPFNTTHFCWIDFGICHASRPTDKEMEDVIHYIPDNIKIGVIIPFNGKNAVQDKSSYYHNDDQLYITSGILSGAGKNILDLYDLYQKEYTNMINTNIIKIEEKIFPILMHENPDKFDLYYTTYYCIFQNINYIHEEISYFMHMITMCNDLLMHDHGVHIVSHIIRSILANKFSFKYPNDLLMFLYISQISAFYSITKNKFMYDGQTIDCVLASILQAIYDYKESARMYFPTNDWQINISFSPFKRWTMEEFYLSPLMRIYCCVI